MASSDPTAPWPPAGSDMPDAMSAGMNATADRAGTSDGPIAAYCRANEALATAASRCVSESAVASNPSTDVGNGPADRTAPSRSLAEQVGSAIWHAIIPPAEAAPGETEQDRLKVQMGEETQDQADEHAGVVQIVPNLSRGPMLTLPVAGGGGASSTHDTSITASGSRYPNVQTNMTVLEFQAYLLDPGLRGNLPTL
jgi:hypothetical protein